MKEIITIVMLILTGGLLTFIIGTIIWSLLGLII